MDPLTDPALESSFRAAVRRKREDAKSTTAVRKESISSSQPRRKESVGTSQPRKESISSSQLRKDSIRGAQLRKGSMSLSQLSNRSRSGTALATAPSSAASSNTTINAASRTPTTFTSSEPRHSKVGHQVARREDSTVQANSMSLPDLPSDATAQRFDKMKHALPPLRTSRSQSISINREVARAVRPSSSTSKTLASGQPQVISQELRNRTSRAPSAASRMQTASLHSLDGGAAVPNPLIQALQLHRSRSTSLEKNETDDGLSGRYSESKPGAQSDNTDPGHSGIRSGSSLKKDVQHAKRHHRPPPEMPPWSISQKSGPDEGGRRTPSLSREGSNNSLTKVENHPVGKSGRSTPFSSSLSIENRSMSALVSSQSLSNEYIMDAHEEEDYDERKSNKYPITPQQNEIYNKLYPPADEVDHHTSRYTGPPFMRSQGYLVSNYQFNVNDFALALNKVCTAYKVLCTKFWRNEKIVDADAECLTEVKNWDQLGRSEFLEVVDTDKEPILSYLSPSNVAAFVRSRIYESDRLELPFKILLIASHSQQQQQTYLALIGSTAVVDEISASFIIKEVLNLYFECSRLRQEGCTDSQVLSLIGSHQSKEEADDFIDFAYGLSPNRHGLHFWRDVCIETVQDNIEGPERDDIESQLKKLTVEVENLRAQVAGLSKRKADLDTELASLKSQRKQIDVESYEAIETYKDPITGETIEISKAAKSALIRTVLGEEAVTDNVSAFLAKHEVPPEVQRHIGGMNLEAFSAISEDQLMLYGLLAKDRRKILALSEFVRNRVKESLQEQAKIKFALERKIMKVQRDYETCSTSLKTAQNSLDINDDMCIRFKAVLSPPNLQVKTPALQLESIALSQEQKSNLSLADIYGFVPFEVDAEVSKSIRKFKDRCRQNHRNRLMKLRKSGANPANGEISDISSGDEANLSSDNEDSQRVPTALSSDAVCLAAFQVMLRHISGSDKFLIGINESIRKSGVLVGPLSDVMPLRVDLSKKGITFNSLLVSVIKSLRDIKRQGSSCPFSTVADKIGVPCRFPVQFEFITDRTTQQWRYSGLTINDMLSRRAICEFPAASENCVDRLWSVNEVSDFDVKLLLIEDGDNIYGGFLYRKDKHDEEKVLKWVTKYHTTLEGIEVGARDVGISSLISRYYSSVFLAKKGESDSSFSSMSSSLNLGSSTSLL